MQANKVLVADLGTKWLGKVISVNSFDWLYIAKVFWKLNLLEKLYSPVFVSSSRWSSIVPSIYYYLIL